MIAASPDLLICGGDMPGDVSGFAEIASCNRDDARIGPARVSPPAFVSIAVSCCLSRSACCFLRSACGCCALQRVGLRPQRVGLLLRGMRLCARSASACACSAVACCWSRVGL